MSFWDHTRVETLRRHAAAGFSAGQIVRLMGAKSRNVIIGKCSREGIQLHGAHRNAPDHEQKERLTADYQARGKMSEAVLVITKPTRSLLWTADELATPSRMASEGASAIAVALGRTEKAVRKKAFKLGISLARVSPPAPVKSDPPPIDVLAEVGWLPRFVAVDPGSSEIGVRRVSLRDLSHTDCRWPLGDPKDKDFAYCGLPSNGGPYCAGHHRVAHR